MRINPCFTNIPVAPWIVPRIRIRSSIFMVHFRCPGLLRRRAATFISLLLTCKYALRLREYRERSRPSGKWARGGDRVESSPSFVRTLLPLCKLFASHSIVKFTSPVCDNNRQVWKVHVNILNRYTTWARYENTILNKIDGNLRSPYQNEGWENDAFWLSGNGGFAVPLYSV